jgi:hypothetical protein
VAGGGGIAAEEMTDHRDDVGLHASQAREHAQPEAVLGHEERVGVARHLLHRVVGVPDEGRVPAPPPVEVVALELAERLRKLGPAPALTGERGAGPFRWQCLAHDGRGYTPASEARQCFRNLLPSAGGGSSPAEVHMRRFK